MPIKDVTVIIDLVRPAGLVGFGKPLIIGSKAGGQTFKNYSDLTAIVVDFPANTEVYKAAAAVLGQGDNRPQTIAIAAYDTADEDADYLSLLQANYDKDWYFLIATTTTKADVLALSDYVEGQGRKMFATRTNSLTDLAEYNTAGNELTFAIYHSDPSEVAKYPEAAWIGERGSRPVGSVTWKSATLTGILPDDLDAAEVQSVIDDNGNYYVRKAGKNVTGEGVTLSGEWIDVVMSNHWVQANIASAVQTLINNADYNKIPYSNAGIAQFENTVLNVLHTGFGQGIIADDDDGRPLYATNFPTRAETTAADRADRILRNGKFSYQLAGAIHQAVISGSVSY